VLEVRRKKSAALVRASCRARGGAHKRDSAQAPSGAAHAAERPIEVAEFLSRTSIDLSNCVSLSGRFHVLKRETLDALERDYFAKLHGETGGNVSEISRRSVREYLQRHGLRASD
jgi:hypothetical protein